MDVDAPEFQVDHPRPTFQVFGTSFVRRVFVGHLIILFDCCKEG